MGVSGAGVGDAGVAAVLRFQGAQPQAVGGPDVSIDTTGGGSPPQPGFPGDFSSDDFSSDDFDTD